MKNNEKAAHELALQEHAGDIAAASMVVKLRGLQDVASKHDFKFLVYMLDIARAEAESLSKNDQHRKCENSTASD